MKILSNFNSIDKYSIIQYSITMEGSRRNDLALLLLRLGFGGFMIYGHGWGKMIKLFTENPIQFGDPIGLGANASLMLAVFAELVCAVFVSIGLFTRYAVIPLIITMAVALLFVHFNDAFGRQEKALMYLVGYICILIAGPGYYSIDGQRNLAV